MFPAHNYLDRLQIPYSTATFSPATPKGAANVARLLGLQDHQAVKTLIFRSDVGERVLIMVGGDRNVISAHLKKVVGSRNVQLASPEEVVTVTGYQVGSIPPFSWQPEGFRSYLDLDLTKEEILGVGSGVWGNEILITPRNLVRASHALVVNLTNRNQPIFPPA